MNLSYSQLNGCKRDSQPLLFTYYYLIMSKKYVGVVGVSKQENAQLGLLLKYIFTNDDVYNALPEDVLRYPDAFTKLCARYS